MPIVDHSTIMDAASTVAAQLEDLVQELRATRHVLEKIEGDLAALVWGSAANARRTPEP